MSGNLTPWLVLAAVLAVSLYFKGYLKLPVSKPGYLTPPVPAPVKLGPADPFAFGPVDTDSLAKLGSHALGLAFAKAVRAEAEATVAGKIAKDAAEAIHATFTAPFSPPAPAGQDPNEAGVKPLP